MKNLLLAIAGILALSGCEPARVRESFTDARLSPDGRTGLFVFKRERYYPGTMGILGAGRPDRYVVNETVIGSYDMATAAVRVLHRRDNKDRYVNETADFRVVQIFGPRALVWGNDDRQYWLDIKTGALDVVPFRQELEARGREVGQIHLVDERGTLVFANKALGEAMNYSAPQELWLRRPGGEYERVAEILSGSNYGFKDNELYYYSPRGRTYLIYNLSSRTTRPFAGRDVPPLGRYDLAIGLHVADHGSPQPMIGRKVDGRWTYEEAKIDTSELR